MDAERNFFTIHLSLVAQEVPDTSQRLTDRSPQ